MKENTKERKKPADKFSLTIEEASEYFEMGVKKLRELYQDHKYDGLFSKRGAKVTVNRPVFEQWIIDNPEIP